MHFEENNADGVESESENQNKVNPVFSQLAEELCSGKDPQAVVADLLSATFEKELNRSRYGKINVYALGERSRDSGRDKSSRRERRASIRPDQIRLYVQMGWKDGYNPKKIAAFFCGLLHLRSQQVDAIDMSDKFCLLSLPQEAGKKALEMAAQDKSLPHMHEDTKVRVSYESRGEGFSGERRGRGTGGKSGRRSNASNSGERKAYPRQEKKGGHTATKRNSKAAIFKKSSQAVEY